MSSAFKLFLKTIYDYLQASAHLPWWESFDLQGLDPTNDPQWDKLFQQGRRIPRLFSKDPPFPQVCRFLSKANLKVLSLVSEHNSEMIMILMMIIMMMMLLTMIFMMMITSVLRSSGQYSELEVAEFSKLASQLPQTQQQGWGNFNSCKIVLFPINFPLL